VRTDGADDGVGFGCGAVRSLNHVFERATEIATPAAVEADGVSVAVKARARDRAIFANDCFRAMPVEEKLLDGLAFRMAADLASAGVPFRIGRWGASGAGAAFFIMYCHSTCRNSTGKTSMQASSL
jgi:hypothetical protein